LLVTFIITFIRTQNPSDPIRVGTVAPLPCTRVRFPSCGIFTLTRPSPVNNELKQQCDGAGEHLKKCKAYAKHAHAQPSGARTRLHNFHLGEFSHQPVPVL